MLRSGDAASAMRVNWRRSAGVEQQLQRFLFPEVHGHRKRAAPVQHVNFAKALWIAPVERAQFLQVAQRGGDQRRHFRARPQKSPRDFRECVAVMPFPLGVKHRPIQRAPSFEVLDGAD